MSSLISTILLLVLTFAPGDLRILEDGSEIEATLPQRYTDCECEDKCIQGRETYNASCNNHKDVYFNCQPSSCRSESCPNDQLFNSKSLRCEFCQPGLEVQRQDDTWYCGCPKGSMYNISDCVPCDPVKSSGVTDWLDCYCHRLVLDRRTRTCRECPNNTEMRFDSCECNDSNMIWSMIKFACQKCPGILVEHSFKFVGGKYECMCEGENEMFNEVSGSCVTCPPDSVRINKESWQWCQCSADKFFDIFTNSCVDYKNNSNF